MQHMKIFCVNSTVIKYSKLCIFFAQQHEHVFCVNCCHNLNKMANECKANIPMGSEAQLA